MACANTWIRGNVPAKQAVTQTVRVRLGQILIATENQESALGFSYRTKLADAKINQESAANISWHTYWPRRL